MAAIKVLNLFFLVLYLLMFKETIYFSTEQSFILNM